MICLLVSVKLKIIADPDGAAHLVQVAFNHDWRVLKIFAGFDIDDILGICEVGKFTFSFRLKNRICSPEKSSWPAPSS